VLAGIDPEDLAAATAFGLGAMAGGFGVILVMRYLMMYLRGEDDEQRRRRRDDE
jgi:hypothetical protein